MERNKSFAQNFLKKKGIRNFSLAKESIFDFKIAYFSLKKTA